MDAPTEVNQPATPREAEQIELAMQADRFRLRRTWDRIRELQRTGQDATAETARWRQRLTQSCELRKQREASRPTITYDAQLPIAARREEIAAALQAHQVIIVCGETGSGKSTQLPKLCLELGRGVRGLIGHTQPRRIAARSVAARVAEELGGAVGGIVGFKVRFSDATNPGTLIKVMTDGMLLAECQTDRFFDNYDTLIIDEAHERSLNIDFLLGYLKKLLPRRPDLKVIVTSATLDAKRFSEFFAGEHGPAPAVEVAGRTYPVEVRYRPPFDGEEADLGEAVGAALDELFTAGPGDILVFLPTEREIHEVTKSLRGKFTAGGGRSGVELLPLYARLSTLEQNRVFEPHPLRRVVLATNVAESSLTVPGIRYVIDTGTARISRYSARTKMQRLPIEAVSQASAEQRKGRCGRLGPGICIRLYDQDDLERRERFTPPEIQRTNLAAVILQTKVLRLGEIESFPFPDPPRHDAIRDGYKTLFELGAIDDKSELTPLGKQISRLPVDPRVGRMVIAGHAEGCLHELLIIASALELQDPRERPFDRQQAADELHARFANPESDFLSYLQLWDFLEKMKAELSKNRFRTACRENMLSYARVREWFEVHAQLRTACEEVGLKVSPRRNEFDNIHRALVTGLLSNVGMRNPEGDYQLATGGKFVLWPGSGVIERKPKWIFAAELVETSRQFVRTISRVNPAWLERLAPHLLQRTYSEPHWEAEPQAVMAYERVNLYSLAIVPRRPVRFGNIDAPLARELYIRDGLATGEVITKGEFLKANEQLLEDLKTWQAKLRRQDLVLGQQAVCTFYDKVLPPDAFDTQRFERWRKEIERTEPKLLYMQRSDLLQSDGAELPAEAFPNSLPLRQMELPLEYHFEPGAAHDGITVTVPRAGVYQLDRHRLSWLVPGLLEEKIIALVKSLPKPLRRLFVPVPDTVKAVMRELKFGEGQLTEAIAKVLKRIGGQTIPLDEFQEHKLPDHLRLNIRVLDPTGETVATGRDLLAIQQELGAVAGVPAPQLEDPRWHRDGITSWDFGELPESVTLTHNGIATEAFPTLVDASASVQLRLYEHREEALRATRAGVRRLFLLHTNRNLKTQLQWLPDWERLKLWAGTLPQADIFAHQVLELLADRACQPWNTIPRSAEAFAAFCKHQRERIGAATTEVANLLKPLLENYHQARLACERCTVAAWQPVRREITEQMTALVPAGFLVNTPWNWLQQYPRYFRAVVQRFEKLTTGGLPRDLQTAAPINVHWQRYLQTAEQRQLRPGEDEELVLYRWMIEEFRVSLFAQTLGTSISVSEKRLEKQWQKVNSSA